MAKPAAILLSTFALACVTSQVLGSPLLFEAKCKPGDNCKAPDCRCWDDPVRPGNYSMYDTPQMILVSFDYSFNTETVLEYLKLFQSLRNPNGCPAQGTFFVQAYGSDAPTVKYLHDHNHELAINSAIGRIPTSVAEWLDNIGIVKELLVKAGIDSKEITGIRSPQLAFGGDDQLDAMKEERLTYDASCISLDHADTDSLLWPYSLDFTENLPYCNTGKRVTKAAKGIWEFPMPVLSYKGATCSTPAGCVANVNTTDDVFRMFYEAFNKHYYKTRAPFILDIDPEWMTAEYRTMGTKQFLELVEAYEDTWVVTMEQALEWIKNPTKDLSNFKPWQCKKQ